MLDPEALPAVPHASYRGRILALVFLILLLAGWDLIYGLARTQAAEVKRSPWARSLVVVPDREPAFEPRYPLAFRRLQAEDLPERFPFLESMVAEFNKTPDGRELVEVMGLERHEYVVLLNLPEDRWPSLLESGRLPQPGTREVLRGPLARFDRFTLDGETFNVVGRMRRDVPGLGFAYMMPDNPEIRQAHFASADATSGWILPEGQTLAESNELDLFAPDAPPVITPTSPAPPSHPPLTILGLVLMAIGGSGLQVQLLGLLSRSRVPVLGPVFEEVRTRPALVTVFHVAYYGLFFLMMWVALDHPLVSLRIRALLDRSFESGGLLGFVHSSYASGNVPMAAIATWLWNYGVATVALVMLPSLVPVLGALFGLVKTALSFGAIGLAMSPLWVGMPETLSYHSGTMVLELEAYIIATFVVTVFTWYVVSGLIFISSDGTQRLLRGAKVLLGGAVLAGIMLAFAALYEAVTIIAFNGLGR